MYKVLALDLDGTVRSDDHTIHPQVKDAICAAHQHYHVLIVTGVTTPLPALTILNWV